MGMTLTTTDSLSHRRPKLLPTVHRYLVIRTIRVLESTEQSEEHSTEVICSGLFFWLYVKILSFSLESVDR